MLPAAGQTRHVASKAWAHTACFSALDSARQRRSRALRRLNASAKKHLLGTCVPATRRVLWLSLSWSGGGHLSFDDQDF